LVALDFNFSLFTDSQNIMLMTLNQNLFCLMQSLLWSSTKRLSVPLNTHS